MIIYSTKSSYLMRVRKEKFRQLSTLKLSRIIRLDGLCTHLISIAKLEQSYDSNHLNVIR